MDRRRLIAMVTSVIVGLALTVSGLAAQEPEPAPGELVLANGPDLTLSDVIAPTSGALFVLGKDTNAALRMQRSDDGGTTWRMVSLPPPADVKQPQVVAIDPTNHTTLYATGAEGLYKTDDDAASWRALLPIAEPHVSIGISPADRQLVYLALRSEKLLRLLRSQDGGDTWETIYTHDPGQSRCDKPVLIVPHPTDAHRVAANVNCEWRVIGELYQSRDRGVTWDPLLAPASYYDNGYPIAVLGGAGAAPERLYAGITGHYAHNPLLQLDLPIYRSDDDGKTWRQRVIVSRKVGGPKSQERNGAILKALVADQAAPDLVYVGLKNAQSEKQQPLLMSDNGGSSWKPLDIGEAKDVLGAALGVDRQNLYAVTDLGLYRLRLR